MVTSNELSKDTLEFRRESTDFSREYSAKNNFGWTSFLSNFIVFRKISWVCDPFVKVSRSKVTKIVCLSSYNRYQYMVLMVLMDFYGFDDFIEGLLVNAVMQFFSF